MKKVISFSLFGNNPIYTIGAIKNADLALKFYPDFEYWYYIHKDTVPTDIIEKLQNKKNVKIILRSGDLNLLKPRTWRFESIDDPNVKLNLSRDLDTRFLLREKLAVDEWIASKKIFHIMRDHPHHMNKKYPIMAGMFGTKKIKEIPSWSNIIKSIELKEEKKFLHYFDQDFLNRFIYPHVKNNCLIHSTFGKLLKEKKECVKKFPIKYCNNYYFVGGYVNNDESISKYHTDILIKKLKKKKK